MSKIPHAFLSHTTYQIVKERVQNFHFDPANIPNPSCPVKLILLTEVIAIVSPHANSRRTVLLNPSKHGHMKKGTGLCQRQRGEAKLLKSGLKFFKLTGQTITPARGLVNTHTQII